MRAARCSAQSSRSGVHLAYRVRDGSCETFTRLQRYLRLLKICTRLSGISEGGMVYLSLGQVHKGWRYLTNGVESLLSDPEGSLSSDQGPPRSWVQLNSITCNNGIKGYSCMSTSGDQIHLFTTQLSYIIALYILEVVETLKANRGIC